MANKYLLTYLFISLETVMGSFEKSEFSRSEFSNFVWVKTENSDTANLRSVSIPKVSNFI